MRSALRSFVGLGLLAALLVHVGGLDGLLLVDLRAVLLALALGVVGTGCAAWRWSLVAGGLGLRLPLRSAVADCYRAVFLNATLPGGILGDVHRAVTSGRAAGDVSRGVRAVVWERTAGQAVQLALAVAALSILPSPVRSWMLSVGVAVAVVVAVVAVVARGGDGSAGGVARWWAVMRGDVRDGVLARWPGVVLTSAGAVVAHVATFLLAARVAGVTAPLAQLVPLVLLALLAMGVPANVAGFGPREGVAAWAFAAAGLPAAQGVATAVVYGALVLAAALPGAAVLAAQRLRTADRLRTTDRLRTGDRLRPTDRLGAGDGLRPTDRPGTGDRLGTGEVATAGRPADVTELVPAPRREGALVA